MSRGFDLSDKLGYRLMQGRLGIYDKYKSNTFLESDKGIKDHGIRISHHGGNLQ